MTKQETKNNLAPIIFPEGVYKVNITVDSEGKGKNKSIPFPYIQNCIFYNMCFFF